MKCVHKRMLIEVETAMDELRFTAVARPEEIRIFMWHYHPFKTRKFIVNIATNDQKQNNDIS